MSFPTNKETGLRIGATVKFHRKKARLTQLELAQLAEVGKTAVFDLEKGKHTVKLSTLLSILRVLNLRLQFSGPLMALCEREAK
jgi:y4mF family transcriptional regulator